MKGTIRTTTEKTFGNRVISCSWPWGSSFATTLNCWATTLVCTKNIFCDLIFICPSFFRLSLFSCRWIGWYTICETWHHFLWIVLLTAFYRFLETVKLLATDPMAQIFQCWWLFFVYVAFASWYLRWTLLGQTKSSFVWRWQYKHKFQSSEGDPINSVLSFRFDISTIFDYSFHFV